MKKRILCVLIAFLLVGCSSKSSVSDKTPAEQIDFTLDDKYYSLPTPVSEFVADGWSFCDDDEIESEINLGSGQYIRVNYCKGNYEIRLIVANDNEQVTAINNANVVGMWFMLPYRREYIEDDFIVIKGVNLASTREEIVKLWGDYPNLYNEKYGVSYHIDGVERYDDHAGFVSIDFYDDKVDGVEVYSTDIYNYERFVSETSLTNRINGDKESAVSITDGYKVATTLDYTIGYVKGTIIEETTIYQESSSYISKTEGYILEDELGQKIALMFYFNNDDFELEIGKEYEIWGWLEKNCYTEEIDSIVAVEMMYVDHEGVEFYNYLLER